MAQIIRIKQAKQARNSEVYDDGLPNGPGMESSPIELETDLNNLRSQLRRIIDVTGNWYDDPQADLISILELASRKYKQDLIGAINNFNLVFSTAVTFRHDGVRDEAVYLNGICLEEGAGNDYIVSESVPLAGFDTITFAVAPKIGDKLAIDFTPK